VLAELGRPDTAIYLLGPTGAAMTRHQLGTLLPEAFTFPI
jgi:cytidine deaminase